LNRVDFQQFAELRLQDAKVLVDQGRYEAAYYFAGYAVECALKACIAKKTKEHDFPGKDSQRLYTHRLETLLEYAGTDIADSLADPAVAPNWSVVVRWNENSRYEPRSEMEARALYNAIADIPHGALNCLRRNW
jgi:HEPN domain-containing protein